VGDRKERFEVWSSGPDEELAGIGSDPEGTTTSTGLRIPSLATPALPAGKDLRYLFMLCGFSLNENERARILGLRQFASLGATPSTGRLLELEIVDALWRPTNSNISWHLRYLPPSVLDSYNLAGVTTSGVDAQLQPALPGTAFRMSQTPALLYEKLTPGAGGFYFNLTAYTPPGLGRPPGEPIGHLGTFHDLRYVWRTGTWDFPVDLPVSGPGFYGFFASVRQQGVGLNPVSASPGAPIEEQFIKTFAPNGGSGAQLWRVAGAMHVEVEAV
jgi:hypothetical protein